MAFGKEYLLTNSTGAYCMSSVSGCNTRKYHGLLVAPQPGLDDADHVLVSAIDEIAEVGGEAYSLATHKYPGTVYPEGYRLIDNFSCGSTAVWVYRLGDCSLTKEIMMPEKKRAVIIKYSVSNAGEVALKISPWLAFRNAHQLQKANSFADGTVQLTGGNYIVRPYIDYAPLYITASGKMEFAPCPDWYYNAEYTQERERGYEYHEDLFVPGFFTVNLNSKRNFTLYIGLEECTRPLAAQFRTIRKQKPITTGLDSLAHAATQFVVMHDGAARIRAGYPWFGAWGRDTFISLPGLFLTNGKTKEFLHIINTMAPDLKNGLLPNTGSGSYAAYNSVDTSLWFIWAMQQYTTLQKNGKKVWKEYGACFIEILDKYSNGTLFNIRMENDGLVSAGEDGYALTWMDAVINGRPVTPRAGKAVEVNALWYNAVCFCLEIARLAGDAEFVNKWAQYPEKIRDSFTRAFTAADRKHLADYVDGGVQDWSVRPNQALAISMPYSPVPAHLKQPVLETVKEHLLTPRGLRTLSPADISYKGQCEGDQETRDRAYHQGTAWPWLLGHYAQAHYNLSGVNSFGVVSEICGYFLEMIGEACLHTIPEIYNGSYPHKSVGAPAQAWSVAEALRTEWLLKEMVEELDKETENQKTLNW